ncbi:prenyltransferase [Nocardiopsis sp. MG754419]|uniref:prenyltransferase n=1 Tax=Nocardiopsis sp. MG754419 TaxID=2259865 RepID=UPI001BAC8752|nr:prenyltransferase [Nocardiopsis sp. MG754419]MBR8741514.1 prenyltransferase [Nocardiopsis sp. MG754419]
MTWDSYRAADHFIMRSARLIDRHRFAFHFQSGSPEPVRAALAAHRNLDGGYGNSLDPDLRGHGSQPVATEIALRHLDELGTIPEDLGQGICRFLSRSANDDGGVPAVLPSVRYTEAAPWYLKTTDFSSRLDVTAMIAGLLHKNHITHPWRDQATAYCWTRINALHWTDPHEAIGICTFLRHVPDRPRAMAAMSRLSTMMRAVIDVHPRATGHVHTPLDLACHPHHIARPLFTEDEIARNLDAFEEQQRPDGGWDACWDHWDTAATLEREGMRTIQRLRVLRAYGRLVPDLPRPPRFR